jgi:outer membrane protein assembly factor BamE (lipoprotein component of BamABCDE complex)
MKKELVAQIQPGVSNTKQIESLFGEPYQRKTYNTGDEEWVYFYAENVTSWSGQAHELKIEFDKIGVVRRYAFGRVH